MPYVLDPATSDSFNQLRQVLEDMAKDPFEGEWIDTPDEVDEDIEPLDFNDE